MANEPTLWGIHAGRTGDADSLFLKRNVIALGWDEMGDLRVLPPQREAFKERYAKVYAKVAADKPMHVANSAGQLYRFVHEMKIGDAVVYPSKATRKLYLGRIVGDYVHDASGEPNYPQRRRVEWIREIDRTQVSQGALYEIGAALSVFVVRNYADEFWAALESQAPPPVVPVARDESVAEVSQDIEENTRDFVWKALAQKTKGHPFAHFVANLLQALGYHTRVAPEGPDGGIDIRAHTDELGFQSPIVKVQCKSSEGSIGDPVISQLYGKVAHNEFGLLVTLGTFTAQARQFERGRSNLRLIDGDELVQLVLDHYDDLDPKYRALIPLRRVYIPDSAGATDFEA